MQREQININGILDDWGYQRSNVNYLLNRNKNKPVLCVVNSFGGSVNEGLAISKLLEQHGDVVVRFIGCCASAATWMAFGAKEIEIAADSFILCHLCSNLVSIYKSMRIEDLDKTIKQLESTKRSQEAINLTIAKKYTERAAKKGKTLEDVLTLMEEERWMTAQEALEWGFVDRIIPGVNRMTDEAKNLIVQNCATLNLPVPVFSAETKSEDDSMMHSFFRSLKEFFTAENASTVEDPQHADSNVEEPQTQTQTTTTKDMKELLSTNAILGVTLTANEKGEVTLKEEQLQKIENALAEANANKTVLTEVSNVLDDVSDNIKSMNGVKNKVLALANLVKMFPVGTPAGNVIPGQSDDKNSKIREVAKDGINEEMRALYSQQHNK